MEHFALRDRLRTYYHPPSSGMFGFPAWELIHVIVGSAAMSNADQEEDDDDGDDGTLSQHAGAELSKHEFAIRATTTARTNHVDLREEKREFMRRFISVHSPSTLVDAICPASDSFSAIPVEVHLGARFELVRDARVGSVRKREEVEDGKGEPIGRWALTFDFDVTDNPLLAAPDPTTSQAATAQCDRWWKVVFFWCRLLGERLKKDFGFCNVLCVYTGNRGAHLHVLDARAHSYGDGARSAIASFYTLPAHKSNVPGKLSVSLELHPALAEIYECSMKPFFLDCMLASEDDGGLALLSSRASRDSTLALISSDIVRAAIAASWTETCKRNLMKRSPIDSKELWNTLMRVVKGHLAGKGAELVEQCIIFSWCWPRLDYNVTAQTKHLSRLPFTPHPKTGRVCIPVDLKKPSGALEEDTFHPSHCPTLAHAGILRSSLPQPTERLIQRGLRLLRKAHARQRREVAHDGAPPRATTAPPLQRKRSLRTSEGGG